MGKIKDIDSLKSQLVLGEVKCRDLWSIDKQSNLKGNPLKAFERSLETICKFYKTKKGRVTYYCIEEIYEINLKRKHKNSVMMLNNKNKSGKICFKANSNVEFVAAVLLNKVQYFTANEDTSFKTVSSWARVCGLVSEKEKVNDLLRNMVDRAIIKLEKLGFIEAEIEYMECSFSGAHREISKEFFEDYRDKSRKVFKKVVGEELYKKYKSFFIFTNKCKYPEKFELEKEYWKEMNTEIEYVYRRYRLSNKITITDSDNEIYLRLIEILLGDDSYPLKDKTYVSDSISEFIICLEEKN